MTIAALLCALVLCAGFFAPHASAATQDDDLAIGSTDFNAGSALLAQATELPASWNYIVNERGQRFATLQAAIDAAQGKTTTITLNGGDKFHLYGDAIIRGGMNVTIQTGDASTTFTGMRIDINGGSLTIAGTAKNRIRVFTNIETYKAAVTFKYCDIYHSLKQERGDLRLENCKVIDLGPTVDKTSKAMVVLTGDATCSLKDTKFDGDIYVSKGCAVQEVDSSTITNQGYRTGNGITVEGGGALKSVKNSTILAAFAAIELQDGSTGPTIENSNLYGMTNCVIAVKGTVSDLKIEPSLEGSGRGTGLGGYYTKGNKNDPLWSMGVVPNGYQLSRWTKDVKIETARGAGGTQKVQYLVRTDCSVTYDPNGGSGNMSASNRKNQWADMKLTVASNKFTYNGAKFTGWNTKKDGTGKAYQPGQTLSFDSQSQVTLYAQWDTPMCIVTFDSQGGSAVKSQRVRKGEKVKQPDAPTRDGYDFNGWFTGTDFTSRYDFSWKVNESKTLYAKWKPKKHTVTFQTNGGTNMSSRSVDHGSTVSPYTYTTRAHYALEDWCTDSGLTKSFDFNTPITADMVLYAKWGGYELCHEWDEGVVTQAQTCTKDEITTITCKADPDHVHTESYVTKKARGHVVSHTVWDIKPPTCTMSGRNVISTVCTCGEVMNSTVETIDALGHDMGNWTVEKQATEYEEGLERRACTREGCTESETRVVPKTQHVHVLRKVDAVEPTCTAPGHIAYWVCEGCDRWYFDSAGEDEVLDFDDTVEDGGIIVPKKAHTPASSVNENIVKSTCTEAGTHEEVTYCSVCGAELERKHVCDPLLDHRPGTPFREDGQEATCDSSGYHFSAVTCIDCDQILECDYIDDPAFGHDWDEGRISVFPTCLTPGERTYTCKHDAKHEKTEAIPALGHAPSQVVRENVHESDGCMDDAFHDDVVYCLACGEELSRKHVIDGHPGHMAGEPIVTTEDPTCTDEGLTITVVECETCGQELSYEETPIPALGHDDGEVVRENEVAPTCTKSGSYDLVVRCTRDDCGEELWRETAIASALGHDWGAWQTVTPATEDEAGLMKRECSRCGAEETRELPKLPHVHVLTRIPAEAATCEEAGVKEFWECDCGAWFFDHEGKQEVVDTADLVVEPAGHAPGATETTDVVEATCGSEGSHKEVVHCTTCGETLSTKNVIDPALSHAEEDIRTETIEDSQPTCDLEGRKVQVTYCSKCGEELAWSEKITSALGHEADVDGLLYENVEVPTCTEEGSYDEVLYCSRCNEELFRVSSIEEALGHDWGEWVTIEEPTVMAKGTAKRECIWCDATQEKVLPELGHTHDLGRVVAKEASCTEEGTVEFWTCVDCGWVFLDAEGLQEVEDISSLIIPKTAHVRSASARENVKEATCTEDGSHDEVVHCLNCNKTLSTTSVTDQAKGHTPSEAQRIPLNEATCEEGGIDCEFVECTTCGEELSIKTIATEPAGHTPGDSVKENIAEPTADADGSYDEVVYCTVCGQELSRQTIVLPASGVEYLVVEGEGAIWEQGTEFADLGLRFVFKRSVGDDQTFGHFLGIRVDGEPVAESSYIAEPGSVVITLLPEFLEALSDGEHVMTVLFDDGPAAEATFTVEKLVNEPDMTPSNEKAATKGAAKSPSTGDNLLIGATSALLMIAVAAFAFSILANRRRRE